MTPHRRARDTSTPLGGLTPHEAIDAALLAEGLLDECGQPVRPHSHPGLSDVCLRDDEPADG